MVEIINFNGEDNIVIQSTNINGNLIEQQKSFQDFVVPYSASYQTQIEDLQDTIEDKKRLSGFINKEVLELYLKKEKLENEKANKEQQVAHLLKELNGKDINDTSSLFQQAFNYFIEGDVDAALSVLEETKIKEEEKKDNKNSKQYAEIRILKARLLIIKNKFEEAGRNYERALEIQKDWKSSLEVGSYFKFLQDLSKTEYYYRISLNKAETDYEKITSLNELASALYANNKFKECDKLFNQAIQLNKFLKENDLITGLPELGSVLNNMGVLWYVKNEFYKAEEYFKDALEIFKRIVKKKNQNYLPQIARITHNLGTISMSNQSYQKAKSFYEESLKITEKLVELKPAIFLIELLAETQNNFGVLEKENKKFVKAEELFLKSINTFKKLSINIQEVHKSFLAGFFQNLGVVQTLKGKLEEAEKSLQESHRIYFLLAESNPKVHLPDLANVLHDMGINYTEKKNFSKAENSYEESIKIKQKFAELNPKKFEITLAKTYFSFSRLYWIKDFSNEQSFQKYILKSIEIFEKYANKNPEAKKWGAVAKNVLAKWKKEWLENFDKVIDETFDEYDEVFKALA